MQIRSTIRTTSGTGPTAPENLKKPPEDQESPDSFLTTHHDGIVGLAGLTGITGAGIVTAQALPSGMSGLTGALAGAVLGAGTGAVAGVVASEGVLLAYPLDPGNEKDKYTAMTRGLGGLMGAAVGGIVGGVAGYFGTQSWVAAPASVLGGAAVAGLTHAGLKSLGK